MNTLFHFLIFFLVGFIPWKREDLLIDNSARQLVNILKAKESSLNVLNFCRESIYFYELFPETGLRLLQLLWLTYIC